MKSIVNTKVKCLLLIIFLFGFYLRISAQNVICTPPEVKCECNNVSYCCKGIGTCIPGRTPANSCDGGYTDLLNYVNDENKLEAAYYTKVIGQDVTDKNVKANQKLLRKKPGEKKGLRTGLLANKKKTITFTPLNDFRAILAESNEINTAPLREGFYRIMKKDDREQKFADLEKIVKSQEEIKKSGEIKGDKMHPPPFITWEKFST